MVGQYDPIHNSRDDSYLPRSPPDAYNARNNPPLGYPPPGEGFGYPQPPSRPYSTINSYERPQGRLNPIRTSGNITSLLNPSPSSAPIPSYRDYDDLGASYSATSAYSRHNQSLSSFSPTRNAADASPYFTSPTSVSSTHRPVPSDNSYSLPPIQGHRDREAAVRDTTYSPHSGTSTSPYATSVLPSVYTDDSRIAPGYRDGPDQGSSRHGHRGSYEDETMRLNIPPPNKRLHINDILEPHAKRRISSPHFAGSGGGSTNSSSSSSVSGATYSNAGGYSYEAASPYEPHNRSGTGLGDSSLAHHHSYPRPHHDPYPGSDYPHSQHHQRPSQQHQPYQQGYGESHHYARDASRQPHTPSQHNELLPPLTSHEARRACMSPSDSYRHNSVYSGVGGSEPPSRDEIYNRGPAYLPYFDERNGARDDAISPSDRRRDPNGEDMPSREMFMTPPPPNGSGTTEPYPSPRKVQPSAPIQDKNGMYVCQCCMKKPKRFLDIDELWTHESEKQFQCNFCGNRFKNKNEAERHQNSLHLRRFSWSCNALISYDRAFHESADRPGESDTCGYCGEDFPRSGRHIGNDGCYQRVTTDHDWEQRSRHLKIMHKFRECNSGKKFFRADHFRQHLKHSHGGISGKWTNTLEQACMKDEAQTLVP